MDQSEKSVPCHRLPLIRSGADISGPALPSEVDQAGVMDSLSGRPAIVDGSVALVDAPLQANRRRVP